MHRPLLCLSLSLAVALVSAGAGASANYPMVIQAKVAAKSGVAIPAPPCTLCHAGSKGGTGTVVTDFGLSMQDFGARGKDAQSLENALDFAFAQGWDSDGDDVPDFDELAAGKDPNDGPGRASSIPRPQHGCAAGRGAVTPDGAVAFLALGLMLGRRRQRRARIGALWGPTSAK